jgi:hypothetical protein
MTTITMIVVFMSYLSQLPLATNNSFSFSKQAKILGDKAKEKQVKNSHDFRRRYERVFFKRHGSDTKVFT